MKKIYAMIMALILAFFALTSCMTNKNMVNPSASDSGSVVSENKKYSADELNIKEKYWRKVDGNPNKKPRFIATKAFGNMWVGGELLTEEPVTGIITECPADDLIPFAVCFRYTEQADEEAGGKQLITSRPIDLIEKKATESVQPVYDKIVAELAGITEEEVNYYLYSGEFRASPETVLNENYFDGWTKEEIDDYFITHPPLNVTKASFDAAKTEEYINALNEAYEKELQKKAEYISDIYDTNVEIIKEKYLDQMRSIVEGEEFYLMYDINDHDWAYTLASFFGGVIAAGKSGDVKALAEKLENTNFYLAYVEKEPFDESVFLGE